MKHAILLPILLFSCLTVNAQFEWRDPLQVDKFWLLYNLAGVGGSIWLGKENPADKGWFSDIYAEYQQGYSEGDKGTEVLALKARLGYQLRKWVSVGGEVQIFNVGNAAISTLGLGGTTWFNWNFVNRPKFRAYFDNGFGILRTIEEFPIGGTKFNFSTNYGFSIDLKIRKATMLKLGVRNMHISNAFLFGDDRNPAFDSIGFLLGFQFK